MKTSGNTILLTGGNSGIGRALAHRFHDHGNIVVIAGRNEARLRETIGEREHIHALRFDATNADSTRRLAAEALEQFPALNVLINNAGIMRLESIAAARDLTDTRETIAANLLGPIELINALVDHLTQQPDAAIINVSSGLAFVPRPTAAVYSATKAAIHSYTISLRYQLAGKVEVIELAPPITKTDLTPGQSQNPLAMPLDEYIEEAINLLSQQPSPPEILVQRVHRQRFAERTGTFGEVADMLARLPHRPLTDVAAR